MSTPSETIAASARKSTGSRKSGVSKAKKSGAAAVASHPTYSQMVKQSVKHLKEKKGSSRAAILKYMLSNYKLGGNLVGINAHLRMALKRGVITGILKQVKGVGASGSFRLADSTSATVKKPKAKKAKRTSSVAKKPKAPKVKRASTAAAKSPAKKTTLKKRKSTSKKPKTTKSKVKRKSTGAKKVAKKH